jgi:hypothetical protein
MMFMTSICMGCASILTLSTKPDKKTEYLDAPGEPANTYTYEIELSEQRGRRLVKYPLCRAFKEKIEVSKKRHRGTILTIPEVIVFFGVPYLGYGFGVGLTDWFGAYLISNNSLKRTSLGKEPTGDVYVCGKGEAAADQELLLQMTESGEIVHRRTDSEGYVDLEDAMTEARKKGESYFNLFARTDRQLEFLRTIWVIKK